MRSRLAAGAAEHRAWQSGRAEVAADFERESRVRWETRVGDVDVRIDGSVDGLSREGDVLVVEEVKTVVLPPARFEPEAVRRSVLSGEAWGDYRLQAELYVFMLHERLEAVGEAARIEGRLVFRNLALPPEASEISVSLDVDLDAVRELLEDRVHAVVVDVLAAETRRAALAELSSSMPFPFESFRAHQRELADAARASFDTGRDLLVSAPPGIGKTAAALHAALGCSLSRGLRVYWVTAKTTQQRIVIETLERLVARWPAAAGDRDGDGEDGEDGEDVSRPPPLRALVLRAREKMCPVVADGGAMHCDGDVCRYAHDFGRRVAAGHALSDLRELPVLDAETVYDRGLADTLCPYELSMLLLDGADLVIGDYNYVFDPRASLGRLSEQAFRDALLVIDEAHNLHGRAREYYSPAVRAPTLELCREWATRELGGEELEALLGAVDRCRAVFAAAAGDVEGDDEPSGEEPATYELALDTADVVEIDRELEALRTRRLVDATPGSLGLLFAADGRTPLETLADEIRALRLALELRDDGSPIAVLVDRRGRDDAVQCVCVDAALPLTERMRAFRSVLAMSATLEPAEYFIDVLGFDRERTEVASFPSPFPRERRRVLVDPSIATTFRRRGADARRVLEKIEWLRASRRGNYLVFASSYAYLDEIVRHVDPARIGDDVIVQAPSLAESDRDEVLALLREAGSARVLLGVQGGIFSEGVDYPGAMAIGVVVVGPGLPRFDVETELVRRYHDDGGRDGFEYAYLYPGMQRVRQAAGRLIRGPDDQGVIVLLGERFADSRYTRLFPEDWYDASPRELVRPDIAAAARAFWEERDRAGGQP